MGKFFWHASIFVADALYFALHIIAFIFVLFLGFCAFAIDPKNAPR